MDRYQRVEKPREEAPIKENEIRITTQGRMRNYISYATTLLQHEGTDEIVLKAMGRAINKTVMIVELIKRRIAGLHQITVIGSTDITDTWEPLEEGLLPIETTRHVSLITITLSKEISDASSVGYQPPLPSDQVRPLAEFDDEGEDLHYGRSRGRGGRTRGRGRGNPNLGEGYDALEGGWSNEDHGYRGRGRGGYRGRGRGGGYGGRGMYAHHENGDEHEGPFSRGPPQGRGRGRGRGGGRGRGREFRSTEPSEVVAQE
ncbi:alba DNA/RNA-binding protein [Wolffia australiana]